MNILRKLEEESVVAFELNETKTEMNVCECCDLWFSTNLSKQEVKQFIDELTSLYLIMNEKGA
jgi:phosphoribosyl-ATP pyrophosphohydrolase